MKYMSLSILLESTVNNYYRSTIKSTACDFVWHPHTSTSSLSLYFPQDKLWVETTTAFHQDLLIIRSFTIHGLGQIIDLRSDCSTVLVQTVQKWNVGALIPLFLLEDIGIIGGAWLLPQQ